MKIKRNFPLLLALFLLIFSLFILKGDEQLKFSISGTIFFSQSRGAIYVFLLNQEQFESKNDLAGINLVIYPKADTNSVNFCFENIPSGVYGIRCFQDENGNGKLDMGKFGPREPWGVSLNVRPFLRAPRFKEICFLLNANIEKLNIRVK